MKKSNPLFTVVAAPALVASALMADTPLSQAASELAPGSWVELKTGGLTDTLFEVGNGGDLFGYAQDGFWDSKTQGFYFLGQGHYAGQKFIRYLESENYWVTMPDPYWNCAPDCINHAFDHGSLDPARSQYFYRLFNSRKVFKYDITQKQWVGLKEIAGDISIAMGMEFFPDLDGMVLVGAGSVQLWEAKSGNWSTLKSGLAMGDYSNFAEYDPVKARMILGGGGDGRDLYLLKSDKTVKKLSSPPVSLGVANSIVTSDPVSGKYLVFGKDGSFYEFEPEKDEWSRINGKVPFFDPFYDSPINSTIAAQVPDYGVVMFVKRYGGQHKVYLYRHAEGKGVVVPPVDIRTPEKKRTPGSRGSLQFRDADRMALLPVEARDFLVKADGKAVRVAR